MTREDINDKVCEILMKSGDGHVDGNEEITDYIIKLMDEILCRPGE